MLLPDEEGIAHFKPLFDEFKEVLHFDDVEEKKPAKKRAAAAEDKEVDEFEGDWNDLLSSDANMKKVTIPQLKVKLKQEGLFVFSFGRVIFNLLFRQASEWQKGGAVGASQRSSAIGRWRRCSSKRKEENQAGNQARG